MTARWSVRDERGDIIGSWMLQLLVLMAVVGLVIHEILSVAVTSLSMDTAADRVAAATASAYRQAESIPDAEEAAESSADDEDLSFVGIEIAEDTVLVTVSREAPTLVVHRIPGLSGLREREHTASHRWRS